VTEHQDTLNFDAPSGEELKRKGMAKVLSHNEEYKDLFYATAAKHLAHNGWVVSEKVVDEIGMPRGSRNAIGAAMRSFAKKNGLKIAHYVKAVRPSCHARMVALWAPTR
jgi:acetyl-CoA carboxylase carboxyltransferase component